MQVHLCNAKHNKVKDRQAMENHLQKDFVLIILVMILATINNG